MRYAWIDQMASKGLWWFSIALACRLLEVSRSGFYEWRTRRQRPATASQREEQLLVAAITVEHIASKRRYGSPRIHAELVYKGWQVGVNRVARLMALHGLDGRSGRLRRHNLTRQAKLAPDIADLLRRVGLLRRAAEHQVGHRHQLRANCPGLGLCRGAVGPVLEGGGRLGGRHPHAQLAGPGCAVDGAHQATAPTGADRPLRPRRARRDQQWLQALAAADARPSMGRVGVCWDNAAAESWFGGLKNELIHPIGRFTIRHEAAVEIARYIRWHNATRRHPALDMLLDATVFGVVGL